MEWLKTLGLKVYFHGGRKLPMEKELEELIEEVRKLRKQMKWSYAGYGGFIFWGVVVVILIVIGLIIGK